MTTPKNTKKSTIGAQVLYGGHNGYFHADIIELEGVCIVRATGPVTPDNLIRPANITSHHLSDFPEPGFWRPDLGVFVVPKAQVTENKLWKRKP